MKWYGSLPVVFKPEIYSTQSGPVNTSVCGGLRSGIVGSKTSALFRSTWTVVNAAHVEHSNAMLQHIYRLATVQL